MAILRFKKLSNKAVVPSYSTEGDAGLDLVATNLHKTQEYWEYGTALAVQIPKGMVGLLFPRSSISKTSHSLRNSVGVIDSGYRGEIRLRMSALEYAKAGRPYKIGDRIAQLILFEYPTMEIIEVDNLDESARGDGGFGSTGE